MRRVVVAGATGYVGRHVVRELKHRGYFVRALTRNASRLAEPGPFAAPAVHEHCDEVFVGEATRPETLGGLFDGIDVAFSSIGLSRQRDGLSFEQVDFAANRNVFDAARAAGAAKLVYVSLWDPDALAHLAIVRAHEKVVALLRSSGVAHCVVRPSGYFSDMGVLVDMAKRGRAFIVGRGSNRMNPIHGADVARVCVDAIESQAEEIGAGGPEVLMQQQAAELAFEILGKKPKLVHLPVPLLRGVAARLLHRTGAERLGGMRLQPSRARRNRRATTCRRRQRVAGGLVLALGACGLTDYQPRATRSAPVESVLPAARACVSIARIERSEVVDNQTVRLHLTDGTIIRSRLPSPCYGLKMQGGFAFRTSTDQLCELDVIHVLPPSGGACALGTFELEHLAPDAEAPR